MALQFTGPFAPMCEQFVAERREAGRDYSQQEKILRMFDNFSKDYAAEPFVVSEELAQAWSQKRPNETDINRYNRVMEMQRFSKYLVEQGYPSFLTGIRLSKHYTHTPYIFTEDEIRRIFQIADSLETCASVPLRHQVMPVLLRVLYGCGLRISEALELRVANVDLSNGLLHIRHGKNGRERLVPMSESLTQRCQIYTQNVLDGKEPDAFFFCSRLNQPYSRSGVGKSFRGLLWDAGIPYLGKERGPSIHDLRHPYVKLTTKKFATFFENFRATA